jgi:hypothetical protein
MRSILLVNAFREFGMENQIILSCEDLIGNLRINDKIKFNDQISLKVINLECSYHSINISIDLSEINDNVEFKLFDYYRKRLLIFND